MVEKPTGNAKEKDKNDWRQNGRGALLLGGLN